MLTMPCDYAKYPPNWKTEIRPRILRRDRDKCKWCGALNNVRGVRMPDGTFRVDFYPDEELPSGARWVRIILTIAHLDHNEQNNEDENLAALCQRCHLRHDAKQHAENARRTRERKQIQLFREVQG